MKKDIKPKALTPRQKLLHDISKHGRVYYGPALKEYLAWKEKNKTK